MIIVNLVGLLLIGLIVWWFWLYTPSEVQVEKGSIVILLEDGSYHPSRIRIQAGQPAKLSFFRKDASPCAATVVFSNVEISEELPLNKHKVIDLPAMSPGNYEFTCPMQMYRGTLLVK